EPAAAIDLQRQRCTACGLREGERDGVFDVGAAHRRAGTSAGTDAGARAAAALSAEELLEDVGKRAAVGEVGRVEIFDGDVWPAAPLLIPAATRAAAAAAAATRAAAAAAAAAAPALRATKCFKRVNAGAAARAHARADAGVAELVVVLPLGLVAQ